MITKPEGNLAIIADEVLKTINQNRISTILYGPSGTGKTIAAMYIANQYATQNNVNQMYIELCPELTKSSVIGGETIKDGSVVVIKRQLLDLAVNGGVIIVDETTHSTEELLLQFNPIIAEPYITDIGDGNQYTINEKTRFIFIANPANHSGNIKLPQSFARRLYCVYIDYPEEQSEIDIVHSLSEININMCAYIVKLYRMIRQPLLPVTISNMVNAVKMLSTLGIDDNIDHLAKIGEHINGYTYEENRLAIIAGELANTIFKIAGTNYPEFERIILGNAMCMFDVGDVLDRTAIQEKLKYSMI
jgi:hypothetical protein